MRNHYRYVARKDEEIGTKFCASRVSKQAIASGPRANKNRLLRGLMQQPHLDA